MEKAKSSKPVIDLAKVEDIKNRETQKYLDKARKNSVSGSDVEQSPPISAAAKRVLDRIKAKSDVEKPKSDAESGGEWFL